MFEEKALLFLYCVSPVHAGSGTAIGVIDSPIQRERHTGHPAIAGSGLKGALRHHCESRAGRDGKTLEIVFGPDAAQGDESRHAGALSLGDAQVVLFPVRSAERAFYYATCPTALGRLHRLLGLAGIGPVADWEIPRFPEENSCTVLGNGHGDSVVLEAFKLSCAEPKPGSRRIAEWISDQALPSKDWLQFFRRKLSSDIVVLHDAVFDHFVRHSTLVEPHVRIEDTSGTAHDTGLFYVENLPPETLLVSLVMASKGRKAAPQMAAREVVQYVSDQVDSQLLQAGGDATTGRGQMLARLVQAGG